jgi:sugar phosphate permease
VTGERRYRWVILAVGVFAQASFAAVFYGLPVLAPALQETYGLSLEQIGVALTGLNLGSLVTVLAWGMLSDRFGERAVITVGQGAAAATLFASAYIGDFEGLVAALVAAGALGACVQTASGQIVAGWFSPGQRGLALAIRQSAVPLGGAVAALSLPIFVMLGGVRAGLLALACGSLASALAAVLWLRPSGRAVEGAVAPGLHPFRDRRLWRLSLGSGLLCVAQSAVIAFVVLFLHETRGLSTGLAAAVLAAIQITGAAARIASGHWSDRRCSRLRPLRELGLALSAGMAATALLLDGPLWLLVPLLIVAGGLSISWNALSFTATAELAGSIRAGAALGLQQTSLALFAAVTPVAFAALVSATSWRVGFAACAVAPLVGTLILVPLREELRAARTEP